MENIAERMYSPSLINFFISAVFGFLNFFSCCVDLGPQTIFIIGIIRAILGVIFFICAILQIFEGEIYGNINLIFSITFGFFSGTNSIITESESVSYSLLQPDVFAFVQIAAGLYLILLLPVMRSVPLYQWTGYLLVSSATVLIGISNLLGIDWISFVAGLFNFVFALLNIYGGLRVVEESLPRGKTLKELLADMDYTLPASDKTDESE